MRLVRLLPRSRPTRGRRTGATEHFQPSRGCVRYSCAWWRGPWGQRRVLRVLTLLCLALVITGLSLLAVSEISIAQKRAVQNVARSSARRNHGTRFQHKHHSLPTRLGNGGTSFKVEPLLRRDAPSVELAAHILINNGRAARLMQLIQREQNLTARERQHIRQSITPAPHLNACMAIPPNLSEPLIPINITKDKFLMQGGSWQPPCVPRHRVAIIIPYRDRWSHLLTLLSTLHPLLHKQHVAYTIFVVEQHGNETFNKGAIMNAAFISVIQRQVGAPSFGNFDCFIFHDVDLIPEDPRNMYTCPPMPRHMSVAVDELNYRLPYKVLVGGVFAIQTDQFFRVNGYSNLYWGWGGEDDDMGYRVQQAGLFITRPPEWIARYKMIKHAKRRPLAWKVRNKLLRTSGRRYRLDGLNTVQFQLLQVTTHPLFTRIVVDVGKQPNNIRMLQNEAEG